MNRSEQREQRVVDILNCALELFVQKGYAGTKTSDIAKEVGMSDGLLFHYFPTKEALYFELVKIGIDRATGFFEENQDDPHEAIRAVIEEFFEQTRENRIVAKMFVLVDNAYNPATTPKSVHEMAKQVDAVQSSVPLIEKGQRMKVFREGNPLALSYAFWNAFQGVMQELARNPEMPIPEASWLMAILEETGENYAQE